MRICEIDGCDNRHSGKGLCSVHYSQQYRKENKEKIAESARRYNKTHFLENKKRKQAYRQKNIEKIKQYEQEYRKKNAQELFEKRKIMNQYHKEYSKKWAEANKSKRRNGESKRRVKKHENGVFLILQKEIDKILNSPCAICGCKNRIELDHIVPISRGGRHSVGNLQPLCKSCNVSKNNKFMIEFKKYLERVS